jgi:hypothetical protein
MTPQPDLFGAAEPAAPARYVPKREHVMSGVHDIIDPMRAAKRGWPWDPARTRRVREVNWPYYMTLLPSAEADEWRRLFDREAARLDASELAAAA